MNQPKTLSYTFRGQPLEVRMWSEDGRARVQLVGLDLSQPLTLPQLEGLGDLFTDLSMYAGDFEG